MSDPEDKRDQYRDEAINALLCAINNTGGLVTEVVGSLGPCLVPKGDTEREWIDLADAYLAACKAVGDNPLIDGKRKPLIHKVTVRLLRDSKTHLCDEENDAEVGYLHDFFKDLPADVAVEVVSSDGVQLYDAHREV